MPRIVRGEDELIGFEALRVVKSTASIHSCQNEWKARTYVVYFTH
jgi:hypothetical protein